MITITTLNSGNVADFVCSVAEYLSLPEGKQCDQAQVILTRIICSHHYSDHVICYPGWDVGRVAQAKVALRDSGEPIDFWVVQTPNLIRENEFEALNQNRLFYWRTPSLANCKHRYVNFLKWLYEQDLEGVSEVRYSLLQSQYAATLLAKRHPSFYQENQEDEFTDTEDQS